MTEHWTRYSRQMLFSPIGKEGQALLLNSRVLIIGMGALGTAAANHLARSGVGYIRFIDRDYVEKSNLQRQMLYDEEDVQQALPKSEAAKRKLQKLNNEITLDAIIGDVSVDNAEQLLEGIDVVIDATDNFETRFLMNDACFKHGIPFIYGGAVSSRGMVAALIPGVTPCLRCLLPGQQAGGQTCDTIGVISPIVDIVASYQVTEALKILTGNHENVRKGLFTLDIWSNHQFEMKFHDPQAGCPTCDLQEYPALHETEKDNVTVLCGRDTVQFKLNRPLELAVWKERLREVAKINQTPFLLKAQLSDGEVIVMFKDGRVLVQGTEDIVRAKTIFARYIGG